jgi:aspartate/methionine/tyrosine aminotransferase
MSEHWIADRARGIEMSGVRKIFELGRSLKDPVNLSIGQPHFPVPEPVRAAAHAAIEAGQNGYTVTQGVPELRAKIKTWVDEQYHNADREILITSGTSGALLLALTATVNPGDEVILFDPYFVAYPAMVTFAGGSPVVIDTYPDFELDVDRVDSAITPRTKAILVNSPANPTGAMPSRQSLHDLALLARERNVLLISDEIYRVFCYDEPFTSPAEFNDETLVVDGFGKAYGMTGWRLGFAHGSSLTSAPQVSHSTRASGRGILTHQPSPPTTAASGTESWPGCANATSSSSRRGRFISSQRPPGATGRNSSPRWSARTCF